MGRAGQSIRPINTSPYVQAMLHASGLQAEAGKSIQQGLTEAGRAIGQGFQRSGARAERKKDRAFQASERTKDRELQRQMQEKGQRLGWARLQFDKQTTLLNVLDDDLKTAQSEVVRQAQMGAVGAGNPQTLAAAQARVTAIQSRQAALKSGMAMTEAQTGISVGLRGNEEAIRNHQAGKPGEFKTQDQYDCGPLGKP